ncbi:MAG: hypothetical protein K0R22_3208, partial [Sporomusa sp.]|nr:hypothetical protein [Sporomusa sp.]
IKSCLLLVLQAAHRTSGIFMMHYFTLFSFQGTLVVISILLLNLTAFIYYHVSLIVSTSFALLVSAILIYAFTYMH